MDTLIVVDMQNDFVRGSLGSESAQAIVPALVDKVRNWDGDVFFTRDTHGADYLETAEGKNLPVKHCIEGTEGWEIIDELKPWVGSEECVFDKHTFGSIRLANWIADYLNPDKDTLTFVGVCTDICVVSNALLAKAVSPELYIEVDKSCCAGTSKEAHEAALKTMESCQINIVDGVEQEREREAYYSCMI